MPEPKRPEEDLLNESSTTKNSKVCLATETPSVEYLFNEVTELFDLKNTEFIVEPGLESSYCDTYAEEGIVICYLKKPDDAIHEGVHAFFEERSQRLWEQLGEEGYKNKIENIVTDEHLEEITSRLIENNTQNIKLDTCSEDVQKTVRFMAEKTRFYENIELGKKIIRLYVSIYDFYCVCPKDLEIYKSLKNYVGPMIIYNKLARYVGTHELI